MKLRLLALAAGLVLTTGAASAPAYAQVAIYATPTFTRVSNPQLDTGPFSFLGPTTTSRIFSGASFGVYDDFLHRGHLDVGGDLRFSIQQGNTAHLRQVIVGPRLAFHPTRFAAFTPYAEFLGGLGTTTAEQNPQPQNRGTFSLFGGLDWRFSKHFDFRVIEVGYTSLQTISTQSHTNIPPLPPSSTLIDISSGIVFRFPQRLVP